MIAEDHFESNDHAKQSLRVWLRLVACTRIIEGRIRRNFETSYGTTMPRFDVLAALEHALSTTGGGLTMGDLSKRLLVSNGNVTGIVERLAAEKHIRKTKQLSDGRSHIVELTSKGKQHFSKLAKAHENWVDKMLGDLSSQEMDAILPTLSRLKSGLTENKTTGAT
jgi:DNA-binding MarR family transcriptional regulator